VRSLGLYLDGSREWACHPDRFRPVTERATDITLLRELAAAVAGRKTSLTGG